MSSSPFFSVYNNQVENTEIGVHNATPNRLALSLSSPWSVTGMPLAQQQADTAMGQDTLLHRETSFVLPTTDSNHITRPLFTQSNSSNFCGISFSQKVLCLHSLSTSMSFWQPVAKKEMFSFILKQLTASKAP